MPKLSEGQVGGVSSFTSCVIQSTLPLSKALLRSTLYCSGGFLCVSFDTRHRIACLLPSLTIVHYHFVLILRVTATTQLSDDGRGV